MTDEAIQANESESHDESSSTPPAPPPAAPAAPEAKAVEIDVHPSLRAHVMSAAAAQAAAEAAVLQHEKEQGLEADKKIAANAGDMKAKLLERLKSRHNERFSHSITTETEGGITIHSFVMFGTKRVATARRLTAEEVEKTSQAELVAHEAMQLHTLAHLTGA
jgi:hypothetical protein